MTVTSTDLQLFFHQLNILYNRLYVISELKPDSKGKLSSLLSGYLSRVPREKQLTVEHIEIHSPAKFSLEGVDKIISQLRGFVRDVSYDNRLDRERKEEDLRHQQEINRIGIAHEHTDLLEKQMGLMKKAGFSDKEIQGNIRKLTDPVERVAPVMQDRKVELLEEKDDK